jgi:hypothetical protein
MHCTTTQMSLGRFLTERNSINLNPTYQRESGVWSPEKQQLFLDSLLNGYDVPKLYLHDLRGQDPRYDFAIIDGKQRLTTIWTYLDNDTCLADDFDLFEKKRDQPAPKPGSKYRELSTYWQEYLKNCSLDVVLVQRADEEDIEDLFCRLNNGEPLNAAEKRNAMGGDMCALIREISMHNFFTHKLAFNNGRYQYYEVAAKLLLLESMEATGGGIFSDLKKRFLDKFVRDGRHMTPDDRAKLKTRLDERLKALGRVFSRRDPLLAKQAYPPVYYLLVKSIERNYAHRQLFSMLKTFVATFNVRRQENLLLPEDQRDPVLIDFGRLMQQGTNDRGSLEQRVSVLGRFFLQDYPDVCRRDPRRAFSREERTAIYHLGGHKCANCGIVFRAIDEMQADHEKQWAHGGPTSIRNARGLCENCNLSLAKGVA